MFAEIAPRCVKGVERDHPHYRRPKAAGDLRLECLQRCAANRCRNCPLGRSLR